ncbi:hypothetical protein Q9L58_002288 [Maublancomyces gigas]|uniref:Uncharacterized protein n=1 Tax=Discina gigas TaxID=1032678 RepID=A0ABR3GSC9_9PEZI
MPAPNSKPSSLSDEIMKLTKIATGIGPTQGNDKGNLGSAIKRVISSALRMGGITNHGKKPSAKKTQLPPTANPKSNRDE